ncbi:hypothetical protein [Mucilaginibacter sp. SG564]|uniref:hypothetical protein n=1 Tax=Mucilaginibacter sp. SG564 TaxID=2587022 RepID=UPI0015559D54|nr:hypothetical protein [Mucilaginibacter sp. SG564]NOW94178.1 hypothetical protein [Mucilaginibacter sp. SG564]
MSERFTQKPVIMDDALSTGKLKVSQLMTLVENHPYCAAIADIFKTEDAKDEWIIVDHIDTVFKRLKYINEHFERFAIKAQTKHISIRESATPVADLSNPHPLIFNFDEYILGKDMNNDLDCFAIYDAKNSYFDNYDMAKYANKLYKIGLGALAQYNLGYFKDLATNDRRYNKLKSYRLVSNNGQLFLRGITSVDKYFEYGVDFTFVVAMLTLHRDMQQHTGNEYQITSAGVSESKLELFVADKFTKDAGEFGKVGSALAISTNDLGQGSLNFTKIFRVGGRLHNGIYLFPNKEKTRKHKLQISHSTGVQKVLTYLHEVGLMLNDTDETIDELKNIKGIKTPDELRAHIERKITSPNSAFKSVQALKDIFKPKIDNQVKGFVKLLEMCNKAEELDIDYDLKEKLRYIISDILLK